MMLCGITRFLAGVWLKSEPCCPVLALPAYVTRGCVCLVCFWAFFSVLFLVTVFDQKPVPWRTPPWAPCARGCSFVTVVTPPQGKQLLLSCRAHHFSCHFPWQRGQRVRGGLCGAPHQGQVGPSGLPAVRAGRGDRGSCAAGYKGALPETPGGLQPLWSSR